MGELTTDAEDLARGLCAGWGCGVPVEGRTPGHDAVARHVHQVLGLADVPTGCPLSACYRDAPPLVHRVLNGLGALEDGVSERSAFPGGVKAVDVTCMAIVRRARNARDRSDELHRERERERKRLADEAARGGR